jgi:hypothetical protein
MVLAILDHWLELEDVDDELLVVMRADIDLRSRHLPNALGGVVATVMAAGIGVLPRIKAAAVTKAEVDVSVSHLLQILNFDGIG